MEGEQVWTWMEGGRVRKTWRWDGMGLLRQVREPGQRSNDVFTRSLPAGRGSDAGARRLAFWRRGSRESAKRSNVERVERDEGRDLGVRQLEAAVREVADDPLGVVVELATEVLVRGEPPDDPFHVGLRHP